MRRGIPHLIALSLVAAAAFRPSLANCFPPKSFSQIGLSASQYVLAPASSAATPQTFIGRFWQPGIRVSTNEGTCDETRWLTRCYDCTPDHNGPVYYVDGMLGSMPCFSGCPQDQMIVVLQDQVPQVGGIFAIGRVTELPASVPRFDFSRIETDWRMVPIPSPVVSFSEPEGNTLRIAVSLSDPGIGYFGLDSTRASDTITAIHLLSWKGISPPVERSAWSPVARFPYSGGPTTGSANLTGACPDSEVETRFVAAALEIDGGQFVTDYVSEAVPVSCTEADLPGAGHVSETGPGALNLTRAASGDLTLAWGPACAPAAPTYEVYSARMGDWDGLSPETCFLAENSLVLPEPADSMFYVVVPYANRVRPPQVEGSYGLRGDGSERAPSPAACRPQWIVACP